jgi:hypothetical protein
MTNDAELPALTPPKPFRLLQIYTYVREFQRGLNQVFPASEYATKPRSKKAKENNTTRSTIAKMCRLLAIIGNFIISLSCV